MCSNLKTIFIPAGVSAIGQIAFGGCPKLTGITVDAANKMFSSLNGVLFNKTESSILQFPGGKSGVYAIPAGVHIIEDSSFYMCGALTSVIIPGSVAAIDNSAFEQCSGLTSLTIPDSVTAVGDYAFRLCTGLTDISIPNSVITIGEDTFYKCLGLTVKGFSGSFTETYTNKNGIPFESYYLTSSGNPGCVIDYNKLFVYGLTTGLTSLQGLIAVPNGYELSYQTNQKSFGTGSIINIVKDGVKVNSFTTIIFGDVNGDGNIDSIDAGKLVDYENYVLHWDPAADAAYLKAGDLNGDGNVDSIDAGITVDAQNYFVTIDQTTGFVGPI
jgi:hypothetical protein